MKNLEQLKAYILKYAKKIIVVDELVFMETKVYHVSGDSQYIIFGAKNHKFDETRLQRVTYEVISDRLEISVHTTSIPYLQKRG